MIAENRDGLIRLQCLSFRLSQSLSHRTWRERQKTLRI